MTSDSSTSALAAEVTTSSYRISGTIRSRFGKIAAILNNLDRSHLTVELATVREHVDPGRGHRVASALVPVDTILFLVADTSSEPAPDAIIVPKRPIRAQVMMSNFRLSGTLFVPESVESVQTAVTTMADTFFPMVDATVHCWVRPELNATYPVLALQRRLIHVISIDEATDPLSSLRPQTDAG